MIVLSRIDARLLHGQVIEAWVPHLRVRRLVVADDAAAADTLAQMALRLAVPPGVALQVTPVREVDYPALAADDVRTLVLLRDVAAAVAAREAGLPDGPLNVGNVHGGPGRVGVSRSVFLDEADGAALRTLRDGGMTVELRAVPAEAPTPLP